MFKLWNYFEAREGYGEVGAIMTFFIYLCLFCLCLLCMYIYILYIHLNGRLIDVYTRITGPDSIFFVPYDSEVSEKYLKWVCFKAHNYKSLDNETKKIAMAEYIYKDASDPSFE
jgi:hypothetical protein